MPFQIIGSDNFQRADENPIAGDWEQIPELETGLTPAQIASFQCFPVNIGEITDAFFNPSPLDNDQWAAVTVDTLSQASGLLQIGAYLRGGSAGAYIGVYQVTQAQWVILRIAPGPNFAVLATFPDATIPVPEDVILFSAVGALALLTLYKNGVEIGHVTDTDGVLTSGLAGIALYSQSDAFAVSSDLFEMGNVVTGFTVSGNAGEAGATVAYETDTASGTVTADGSGNYITPHLAPGMVNITPSLAGFSFSPSNRLVTISTVDLTGVDFTATPSGSGSGGGGGFAGKNSFGFGFGF